MVHTGRPLKHKHTQGWTQVSGTPKRAQSRTRHARNISSTHMQGWPFMFTFCNMYPEKQSILGSALVHPISTWIPLSRSIQLTYMHRTYPQSLLSSKGYQGAPTGCLVLGSRLCEDVQPHVCRWFFLGRWIQVKTGHTRADLKMDGFPGTCYEMWAWRANAAWVDNMPLTCRIWLCALFPDWGSGPSVNLFGRFPWMNQSRYVEQPCEARRFWSTEPV